MTELEMIRVIMQSACLLKLFTSIIYGFVLFLESPTFCMGISSILYFSLHGKLCEANCLPFIRN